MTGYFPFQILPIVESKMLAWVVYDEQMKVLGSGTEVSEADAKAAISLLVGRLKRAEPERSWSETEPSPDPGRPH